MMPEKNVVSFFDILSQTISDPTTELIYHSNFELLIAVILSAQATDISVNKATKHLFAKANTPKTILELGLDGLIPYIQSIGLFRSKGKHIIQTCDILVHKHNSQIPSERTALEALPGVGRKTANVVLNTAFGIPVIAVDTHIFRVANRTGIAQGNTPLSVEKSLMKRIASKHLKDAHHLLILHGRYTCKARQPLCGTCPVGHLCQYPKKLL